MASIDLRLQSTAIVSLSQLEIVFNAVNFAPLFVTLDSVMFHTAKSDILAGRFLHLHDFETVQVSIKNNNLFYTSFERYKCLKDVSETFFVYKAKSQNIFLTSFFTF